ncbi:MAG: hypothetical protein U1F36_07695 [Planctomycetota bacterium]
MSGAPQPLNLSDGGPLLPPDDVLLARVLAATSADGDPIALLREELAGWCGLDAPVALFGDLAAARARMVRAARPRDAGAVLCIGGRDEGLPAGAVRIPFAALGSAIASIEATADPACVVLEPRGELATLRAIAATCARRSVRLLLDESRTAARLAARTVGAEVGIEADAVLLGDSLADGEPFGAVVGIADPGSSVPSATARRVRAVVQRLSVRGVHEQLSREGVALRSRFVAQVRKLGLRARLLGPAALMQIVFDAQDNIDGARITARFLDELAAVGLHCGPDIALSLREEGRSTVLADAFDAALARIRTRLVEHNAQLSDDLPGVFCGLPFVMRAEGLSRFVQPRQARGEVTVDGDGLCLTLEEGPLGPGASVGFTSRRSLQGDFDLRVRFELQAESGEPLRFALFAQEERGSGRVEASWLAPATADATAMIVASFDGAPDPLAVPGGPSGWLRITREGGAIAVSCAGGTDRPGDFTPIARRQPRTPSAVRIGCRLVGAVRTAGARAKVTDFEVVRPGDRDPRA